jgi:hypothetical protein
LETTGRFTIDTSLCEKDKIGILETYKPDGDRRVFKLKLVPNGPWKQIPVTYPDGSKGKQVHWENEAVKKRIIDFFAATPHPKLKIRASCHIRKAYLSAKEQERFNTMYYVEAMQEINHGDINVTCDIDVPIAPGLPSTLGFSGPVPGDGVEDELNYLKNHQPVSPAVQLLDLFGIPVKDPGQFSKVRMEIKYDGKLLQPSRTVDFSSKDCVARFTSEPIVLAGSAFSWQNADVMSTDELELGFLCEGVGKGNARLSLSIQVKPSADPFALTLTPLDHPVQGKIGASPRFKLGCVDEVGRPVELPAAGTLSVVTPWRDVDYQLASLHDHVFELPVIPAKLSSVKELKHGVFEGIAVSLKLGQGKKARVLKSTPLSIPAVLGRITTVVLASKPEFMAGQGASIAISVLDEYGNNMDHLHYHIELSANLEELNPKAVLTMKQSDQRSSPVCNIVRHSYVCFFLSCVHSCA